MNTSLSIGGSVGIRGPIPLARQCEAFETHEHNYDHTLQVLRGRVSVAWSYTAPDGRAVTGESEVGAFDTLAILANARHTVRALEDGVVFQCLFSHRDFGGVVIQRYAGNPAAYALAPGA